MSEIVSNPSVNATSVSVLQRLRQPHDKDAWGRFVRLYTPLLFYWARRVGGLQEPDAADLVQDVFTTLLGPGHGQSAAAARGQPGATAGPVRAGDAAAEQGPGGPAGVGAGSGRGAARHGARPPGARPGADRHGGKSRAGAAGRTAAAPAAGGDCSRLGRSRRPAMDSMRSSPQSPRQPRAPRPTCPWPTGSLPGCACPQRFACRASTASSKRSSSTGSALCSLRMPSR